MTRFDDIRHYTDLETRDALKRIVHFKEIPSIVSYAFPQFTTGQFVQKLESIQTTDQLQHEIMVVGMREVIRKTMTSFTSSGFENIKPDKACLFISNHRDIVLDAYLLQCLLDDAGMVKTRITFGSNLMKNDFLREAGLCNKMFRTERGGTAKGFYAALAHLSDYINNSILNDNESIWIAQRGGRTKDGHDATDPALIKMLGMASPHKALPDAYASLNIIPLTISYEWEPCDCPKAVERCITLRDGRYQKTENEDLNSIITGITQPKGNVHLAIGKPVTAGELIGFPTERNEFCNSLAALLDSRINAAYRLSPNNYIACDLLSANRRFADQYNDTQLSRFTERLERLVSANPDLDQPTLRTCFLQIYANSVRCD